MREPYEPSKVVIERLALKGVRVDRVHGKEYLVAPRYYRVKDGNLKRSGEWTIELHKKFVERSSGTVQEVTIAKALVAPLNSSLRMASLTRQSIMIVPATKGTYRGKPYAHVSFRPVQTLGGRRTALRGQKGALPEWFHRLYGRRIRLRATVQGKIESESAVGRRLSKFHDIKQVVVFDSWNDEDFIRFLFVVRIYAADLGFTYESQAEG